MPTDSKIIEATQQFVRSKLEGEGSGHDWWHIHRVYNNAIHINESEHADAFIVSMAALLHDIADYKICDGSESERKKIITDWLDDQGLDAKRSAHICKIIDDLSFKGAGTKTTMTTLEGKIVQDADRLDAIGAVGIARAFAYGGHKNREIYNPEQKPEFHQTFEAYKNSAGSTINHFHEKLLLLKDLMNTDTAKQIAAKRHAYMQSFLDEFDKEWNGADAG